MNNSLVAEYRNRKPDGHFFDPDTMRFFRSRIGQVVKWNQDGPIYFITSEKGPRDTARRRYTARVMDPDGNIDSIGKFNENSRDRALRLAEDGAREGFTAHELSNGGLAISCIGYAKEAWEKAGGSITPEVEMHRRNAESWAKAAGWVIEWTSITPHIHRKGRDYMVAELLPYID